MSSAKQKLDIAKAIFIGHRNECPNCQRYDGSTNSLQFLCLSGVLSFKDILSLDIKGTFDIKNVALYGQ